MIIEQILSIFLSGVTILTSLGILTDKDVKLFEQVLGTSISSEEYFIVSRVIDGDTIELNNGQKVRYIGIDTPEINQNECFAYESTQKNVELVLNKEVRLEKDTSETDKYGRLLRYVWIDNLLVNQILVEEGFALSASYPPDVKYQDIFRNQERYARQQKLGLWSKCSNSK